MQMQNANDRQQRPKNGKARVWVRENNNVKLVWCSFLIVLMIVMIFPTIFRVVHSKLSPLKPLPQRTLVFCTLTNNFTTKYTRSTLHIKIKVKEWERMTFYQMQYYLMLDDFYSTLGHFIMNFFSLLLWIHSSFNNSSLSRAHNILNENDILQNGTKHFSSTLQSFNILN